METDIPSYQELVGQLKKANDILDALRQGQTDAVIGEHEIILLRMRQAENELLRNTEMFKQSMEIIETLRKGQADAVVGEREVILLQMRQAEDDLLSTSDLVQESIAGATQVIDNAAKAVRTQSELEYLREHFWKEESRSIVRTKNPLMQKVFDQVRSVAPTLTTVLLTGETGTGKGVIARLIHRHSRRSDKQFISVHCGAIPDSLIESELFGHEKGAFTGAIMRKLGKFEIAQGGTIFLDEIGTVTQSVQIKLLQVLQEKIFSRVSGETAIKADGRVIAASNTDLMAAIKEGSFREDLFYRLNVFPIEVPPLRERVEDIPLLVQKFLAKCNLINNKNILSVHPSVLKAFRSYPWPGNIRELENLIERAHIVEQSRELTPESFPAEIFSGGSTAQVHLNTAMTLADVRQDAIESVERQYIKQLLAEHKGKIDVSAVAAGVGVRQMHKLLTKYKIEKNDYKDASRNIARQKSEL
ncbi:MAG: sigma-54-dependent Fis family transcriptional regulator [Deltaproteobacteria bacterium]|nr:sigma-54-dependent Fis family transcriptional regulator [Deltaproteobacteria bacterium]